MIKLLRKEEGKKQVVLGDHQTIKLTGNDTNGQFLFVEQFDQPGVRVPMHIHKNEDELFKVLEGKLKITVGNKTQILTDGDLAFCPRGIPHTWEVIGDKPLKSILIVTPSGLETMFEELSEIKDFPPDFSEVAEIAARYDIEFV